MKNHGFLLMTFRKQSWSSSRKTSSTLQRVYSDIPAAQAKKLVSLADCKIIWLGRSDGSLKEADSDDDPSFEIH